MKQIAFVAAVLAMLMFYTCEVRAQHVRKGWYIRLTPTPSHSCLVGPWFTLNAARDWLGSAQRAHPFACHIRPNAVNCRDLGNGYGYLQGTPYPPSPQAIPAGDAELLPIPSNPHLHGKFIRLFYGADGSCTVVVKGQQAPPIAGAFTYYADTWCPHWPWLLVADRPDGVCN